ncbi:uncharacterized protein EV420DRAFT_1334075 [Desarmillaria tabescens]|uniref:Uncharacterized protein n=1 Tax=Armillaria tabescens TaxID=1929756 RepID=A0AA39KFN6_ARMTA|nr:uncharacterized protein EV420DRAFT_1334075 [Desarmillaria tabescens]KAK0458904.1 hypothetical protein EV420DRAFT_1334075 [Desarmillaria tabescens]
MRLSLFFALSALPVIAFACEGECITGVTAGFVNDVRELLKTIFPDVVSQVYKALDIPSPDDSRCLALVNPMLAAFEKQALPSFQHAIFPSFFHGKCQVNGVDPDGCPNPDCPVVCGTPGSLIHFYPILLEIVYNSTMAVVQDITSPHSDAYQETQKTVFDTLPPHFSSPRMFRFSRSTFYPAISTTPSATGFSKRSRHSDFSRAFEIQMRKISQAVTQACKAGNGGGGCTFPDMKKKILSYP